MYRWVCVVGNAASNLVTTDKVWFFLTGGTRSGTTVLQQILNTHPHVGCMHEYGLKSLFDIADRLFDADRSQREFSSVVKPKVALQLAAASAAPPKVEAPVEAVASSIDTPPPAAQEIVAQEVVADPVAEKPRKAAAKKKKEDPLGAALAHHTARDNKRPSNDIVDLLPVPRRESFFDILEAVYRATSGKGDLQAFGDKMPNLDLKEREALKAQYGLSTKVVVVIRNPLDVVSSSMHRAKMAKLKADIWHVEDIGQAIEEWLRNWDYALAHRDDPDHLFVKYESLANNFEEEAGRIAAFLGVENRFENLMAPLPEHARFYGLASEELAGLRGAFHPVVDAWDGKSLSELFDLGRVHRVVADGSKILFGRADERAIGSAGFGDPEPEWCWTVADRARVQFRIQDAPPSAEAWIDLEFIPSFAAQAHVPFIIRTPDGKEMHHRVRADEPMPARYAFTTRLENGVVDLELLLPVRKRPQDEPVEDTRELGLAMRSIQVKLL